jgi:poly-gamma-glutamate synthase PgsB/CapB
MTLILVLLLSVFAVYAIEMLRHESTLRRLPIRIHVNGTRGKSSVTRLIAAGLREGGYRTFAKTTGSAARMIHADGREEPVERTSAPNIREQLGVMRRAVQEGAEALVIECMAVRPDLQRISEKRIVRSSIGVITNIRPDHLEVMGPRLEDVAMAISSTVPRRGKLYTSEPRFGTFLRGVARRRGSDFILTAPANEPTREEMEGFTYVEIPANVALALEICHDLGVERPTALRGMYRSIPDVGATTRFRFHREEKTLSFLNVFAANDRESITMLWRLLGLDQPQGYQVGVVVNNRGDRMRRAQDIAEVIARDIRADWYIAAGDQASAFIDMAARHGVSRSRLVNMGGRKPAEVLDRMFALTERDCTVMGIGNIGGFGLPFIGLLEQEHQRGVAEAAAEDGEA